MQILDCHTRICINFDDIYVWSLLPVNILHPSGIPLDRTVELALVDKILPYCIVIIILHQSCAEF